jgi:thiamine transporter
MLAEIAVMIGLSGALYLVRIFTAPEGGSVTLASMVPIFVLAIRRGPKIGITGGVIFGFIALLEDATAFGIQPVGPAQVFLDYPLAFGLLGLAGFLQKQPLVGVVIGIAARFCSHFVSGVIFFASYASDAGLDPYTYSAVYNGSFLLAEMAITLIIMVGLIRLKAFQAYL